jgi:hypothetical protein
MTLAAMENVKNKLIIEGFNLQFIRNPDDITMVVTLNDDSKS